MDKRFRVATVGETSAIMQLVHTAYRGEPSRAGWTTEADLLDGRRVDVDGVREAISKPDSRVLLLEEGKALLACAHLAKREDACYFGMFAVRPVRQGAGVGKSVLAEAEKQAVALWQSQTMEMAVIDLRDDLIAWYVRRGYRRTGQHAPFPYGDARFGIPRRDDLRFEWLVKTLPGGQTEQAD